MTKYEGNLNGTYYGDNLENQVKDALWQFSFRIEECDGYCEATGDYAAVDEDWFYEKADKTLEDAEKLVDALNDEGQIEHLRELKGYYEDIKNHLASMSC